MIELRSDIINGDHRALYLGWLAGAAASFDASVATDDELDDDEVARAEFENVDLFEPPVPPGLGEFTGPLRKLAGFLRLDRTLIDVAAERSTPLTETRLPERQIRAWLAALPSAEKDELLVRLIRGEARLGADAGAPPSRRSRPGRRRRASQRTAHDRRPGAGRPGACRRPGAARPRAARPRPRPARRQHRRVGRRPLRSGGRARLGHGSGCRGHRRYPPCLTRDPPRDGPRQCQRQHHRQHQQQECVAEADAGAVVDQIDGVRRGGAGAQAWPSSAWRPGCRRGRTACWRCSGRTPAARAGSGAGPPPAAAC